MPAAGSEVKPFAQVGAAAAGSALLPLMAAASLECSLRAASEVVQLALTASTSADLPEYVIGTAELAELAFAAVPR